MLKRFVTDIIRYKKYIIYSAKSMLKSEVSTSYLNALWWLLNPLCYMLIYMFVVLIVFKTHEENFPVFVFIGIMFWNFFSRMLTGSTKLISNNKNIITKVYVPKYVLLISYSFTLIFKMLISLSLIFILMLIFKITFTFKIFYIIPIFIILYVITFGLSLILMHLGVYINDFNNIISLFIKLLNYFSGVFYSIPSRIPTPYNKVILNANPIAFIINESRNVLMYNINPNSIGLIIWFIIGITIFLIGLRLIYKYEGTYAKVMT